LFSCDFNSDGLELSDTTRDHSYMCYLFRAGTIWMYCL